MKITTTSALKNVAQFDAIIVPIFLRNYKLNDTQQIAEQVLDGRLQKLIKNKRILGKPGEITVIDVNGPGRLQAVICLGMGQESKLKYNDFRNHAGSIIRHCDHLKLKKVLCYLNHKPDSLQNTLIIQAWVEGLGMGRYRFDAFKTKEHEKLKKHLQQMVLCVKKPFTTAACGDAIRLGKVLSGAVNSARELANTPSNMLTPTLFVERAKTLAGAYSSLEIEVIEQAQARKLGMHALLGVAQGSIEPPYMLIIKYLPNKNQAPICLVGKGITFDSGGISIKPSKGMEDMKGDMGGAAAVLCSMLAIAELRPKTNVIGVIPLAENMPSGSAQRPGDVVTAMNGKTIEVINTDAEGRLILADALAYAVTLKPSMIIDLATLTGGSTIALGDIHAAIMGNKAQLIDKMRRIGAYTGETVWELPMDAGYFDYIKSDIADVRNSTQNGKGSTITGGKFLELFVDKTPWIHIDMANVSDFDKTKGYTVKGMSGFGVRNLVQFVLAEL